MLLQSSGPFQVQCNPLSLLYDLLVTSAILDPPLQLILG